MGIANIINNSTTTSGGEIIRELVNASDGAGLHFDGASSYISLANNAAADFGLSDFSIEFILNQTQASTDETYYVLAPHTGNNRMGLWYDKDNSTLKIFFRKTSNAHYPFDYDMANDFGTPTHYVVTADRNGLATLYKNGNSVASVDISASSDADIGNTNPTYISNNSTSTALIGSIYRFRTWNKALTSAEVQTAFERSDVDFADQYGSQTETSTNSFVNSGFAGFSGNAAGFTTTGSASGDAAYKNQTFTGGKKYRLTFTITDGNSSNLLLLFRSSTGGAGSNVGTIESTNLGTVVSSTYLELSATGNYELILSDLGSAQSIRIFAGGDVGAVDINAFSIVQIGCVSDYDLAFANPTQSLTVQDRSGAADGTASASGVSQVQPVVQGNLTSLAVGAGPVTPSDNQIHLKAADGEYGIIHQNASGVKVSTYTGSSSAFIGTQGAHSMGLATGGSEKLIIDASTGNIRIGDQTSDIDTKLKLDGANGEDNFLSIRQADQIQWHMGQKGGDTKLYFRSGNVGFETDRLTIDSSGNVSIAGVADPYSLSGDGAVNQLSVHATGTNKAASLNLASTGTGWNGISLGNETIRRAFVGTLNGSHLVFYTNNSNSGTVVAERMRISSTGAVGFGITSGQQSASSGSGGLFYNGAGSYLSMARSGDTAILVNRISDTGEVIEFRKDGADVGNISVTASATAFNTSSDYRLKENLTPLTGALDRIDQLPVYRFNFIADPDTTVDGFVAHEVSEHVPEAVTGEKDAMKTVVVQEAVAAVEAQPATYWEEGDELPEGVAVGDEKTAAVEAVEAVEEVTEEQPDYQGIDQSKLVPLLVAAVKELKAKVEILENA